MNGGMDIWRVVLLGDNGVGKTTLAMQFTLDCFVEICDPTIEDSYRKQHVVDNKMCFVEVIDTPGQVEEFGSLGDRWVREGQGFILVYSITSRPTFDRLENFRQAMLRVKGQRPTFVLVGNKSDKVREREVLEAEGVALAKSFGCPFMETSAKTAHNVELLFANLVRILRNTPRTVVPKPDRRKSKCVIF